MTSHQPYCQSLSTGQIYWTARHETDRSLHHCRLPLSLCGRGHRLHTGRAVYSHRQMSGLSGEEEKTGHLHQVRGSVSPAAGGTEVSDLQSSSEESLLFSTCGVRTVTVDDRLYHWRKVGRKRRVPIHGPHWGEKSAQRGLSQSGLSLRIRDTVELRGQHHTPTLGPHCRSLQTKESNIRGQIG